jgi:hypothetical protein
VEAFIGRLHWFWRLALPVVFLAGRRGGVPGPFFAATFPGLARFTGFPRLPRFAGAFGPIASVAIAIPVARG